jgi:regulator of sigma E protease
MELATQIFQFILSISILVVLHELGHFLPAKWFKCRVEKFYLFFDPWFSLFKKKLEKQNTELVGSFWWLCKNLWNGR